MTLRFSGRNQGFDVRQAKLLCDYVTYAIFDDVGIGVSGENGNRVLECVREYRALQRVVIDLLCAFEQERMVCNNQVATFGASLGQHGPGDVDAEQDACDSIRVTGDETWGVPEFCPGGGPKSLKRA